MGKHHSCLLLSNLRTEDGLPCTATLSAHVQNPVAGLCCQAPRGQRTGLLLRRHLPCQQRPGQHRPSSKRRSHASNLYRRRSIGRPQRPRPNPGRLPVRREARQGPCDLRQAPMAGRLRACMGLPGIQRSLGTT